jgi:TolB-like protein
MKFRWIVPLLFVSLILLPLSSPFSQTRDSGKAYRVAVLPFLIHSQENLDYLRDGIYDILSSRIAVEGRITVIDRAAVERALYEERPMRLDEPTASKIGMKVGADYIVLGSLTKVGDYISLDARLISITEEKPPLGVYTQHKGISDVMGKIGDFALEIGNKVLGRRPVTGRIAAGAGARQPSWKDNVKFDPESMGFKKSQTFNFEIKGIDVGDVDGDKKNELVMMDHHNIYVFKYDGEKLNLFQKIEAADQNDFLTLDVADVNRTGFAEIIVTSVIGDNLQSFILEYEDGRFRKIAEKAGWYFRVLEHPKEGPLLVGQQMGPEGIFMGPIYRFIWKKNAYERGSKISLPKETNIFGFTMADLRGTGKPEILAFDRTNRLNIITGDGKTVWRGRDQFGGTNNFYDTKKKKEDAYRPQDSPAWRVFIPGRILVRDLTGDGVPQVIVNKNDFTLGSMFDRLKAYDKGEIHSLVWDESALTTNWKTREIKGYIADYQVKDVENTGNDELVVAVISPDDEGISGALSRQHTSYVLFFKLF